jgi:hypothetical protein
MSDKVSELMPITGREFGYGGDKHQDGKKIRSVHSIGTGIQYIHNAYSSLEKVDKSQNNIF